MPMSGAAPSIVHVIGHTNPDTDSVCSAIGYAHFKNLTDKRFLFTPARAGKLNEETVFVLKKFGVPVHVRSTFKPDPGTLVTREDHSMEDVVVTGITHDRGQAKVSILRVPDRPGIASRVFGGLGEQNIVVDMIVQNISRDGLTDISFTLPRADRMRAEGVLGALAREIGAEGVVADDRVAKISIVGVGMRSHSGVAARMFGTLSGEGINIQMISTSEIAVSCVIEDKYTELAVRALHDAFALGAERGA